MLWRFFFNFVCIGGRGVVEYMGYRCGWFWCLGFILKLVGSLVFNGIVVLVGGGFNFLVGL